MVDLSHRARDPELLDQGVPREEALRSLADLRFVNRWLGNRRRLAAVVRPHLVTAPAARAPRLLDVGCGSGDVPAYVAEGTGRRVVVVGLDLKPLHLGAAPREILRVAADVRALPFPPRSFDVVTASLFLHHFNEGELPAVLAGLFDLARSALVVNDLRRARVPYLFGRVAFRALFRSYVSVEDGLVSIRRAFTEAELRAAFEAAGIRGVVLRRTWPYRLLAVAERSPDHARP